MPCDVSPVAMFRTLESLRPSAAGPSACRAHIKSSPRFNPALNFRAGIFLRTRQSSEILVSQSRKQGSQRSFRCYDLAILHFDIHSQCQSCRRIYLSYIATYCCRVGPVPRNGLRPLTKTFLDLV